jgi:hypothetical protein
VQQVVNMDCKRFDSMLEDLERDTSLPPGARDQALQHAEDCAYCRARLAAARLLSLELSALAKGDENLHAPARVEASLVAAFQERNHRQSRVWWSVSWVGAAAAVAIAAWLLVEHPWRSSEPPAQPKVEAVASAAPHRSTSPAATVRRQNETTEARVRDESTHPLRQRVPANGASEFIALSSTSYPVGDGMVVRVELPRSAPALVGLPIPGGDVSGTVTADVVLGQDGMARAIRFVQPEEGQGTNRNVGLEQK